MHIEKLPIEGLLLIKPKSFADARGSFCESFRADIFQAAAGDINFVQDNRSVSVSKGTVRGLHYQKSPHAQSKLVHAVRGKILDVAVDARKSSPTFGHHLAIELSSENLLQLFVPKGFLHGFCTLVDESEVAYKVDDFYSPQHDACIRWDDQALAIKWPFPAEQIILSDKDRKAAPFESILSTGV